MRRALEPPFRAPVLQEVPPTLRWKLHAGLWCIGQPHLVQPHKRDCRGPAQAQTCGSSAVTVTVTDTVTTTDDVTDAATDAFATTDAFAFAFAFANAGTGAGAGTG